MPVSTYVDRSVSRDWEQVYFRILIGEQSVTVDATRSSIGDVIYFGHRE